MISKGATWRPTYTSVPRAVAGSRLLVATLTGESGRSWRVTVPRPAVLRAAGASPGTLGHEVEPGGRPAPP